MRKIWSQIGLDPWDWQINLLVEGGMDRHKAKSIVVMNWMKAGDPGPLLALIREEKMLRGPALWLLVQMLQSGQLVFKKGRGRRPDPEAAARDQFAADTYEEMLKEEQEFLKDYEVNSDRLFRAIGAATGVSEESVRQAVTTSRKPKPQLK
jgi:hypothetical protein